MFHRITHWLKHDINSTIPLLLICPSPLYSFSQKMRVDLTLENPSAKTVIYFAHCHLFGLQLQHHVRPPLHHRVIALPSSSCAWSMFAECSLQKVPLLSFIIALHETEKPCVATALRAFCPKFVFLRRATYNKSSTDCILQSDLHFLRSPFSAAASHVY